MAHWGWYWKVKRNHKPKALCSYASLLEIDSFKLFKNTEFIRFIKESIDRICLIIPKYNLFASLQDDNNLRVQFGGGSYVIPVEKKSCNYGGFYHFFRCPSCNMRMRKLYCIKGIYLCRKCAHLGYYSQRLRPPDRCIYMQMKVKEKLENHTGSLEQKPPWMKGQTFQKLRRKYVKYDEKHLQEVNKELFRRFGCRG